MAHPKPVTIRGVTYESQSAAARALGVYVRAIQSAIERGTLATVGLNMNRRNNGVKVSIDGVLYPSIAEASRQTGISYDTLYQIARDQKETPLQRKAA